MRIFIIFPGKCRNNESSPFPLRQKIEHGSFSPILDLKTGSPLTGSDQRQSPCFKYSKGPETPALSAHIKNDRRHSTLLAPPPVTSMDSAFSPISYITDKQSYSAYVTPTITAQTKCARVCTAEIPKTLRGCRDPDTVYVLPSGRADTTAGPRRWEFPPTRRTAAHPAATSRMHGKRPWQTSRTTDTADSPLAARYGGILQRFPSHGA